MSKKAGATTGNHGSLLQINPSGASVDVPRRSSLASEPLSTSSATNTDAIAGKFLIREVFPPSVTEEIYLKDRDLGGSKAAV